MHVQMLGDASSGSLALVESDIDPGALVLGFAHRHGVIDGLPKRERFGGCEVTKTRHAAIGKHQQMAAPVRIDIEDHADELASMHDAEFDVLAFGRQDALEQRQAVGWTSCPRALTPKVVFDTSSSPTTSTYGTLSVLPARTRLPSGSVAAMTSTR